MPGMARKISAAIRIQNAYRRPDRARAYPPSVPKVSEIVVTASVTIRVFSAGRQNASSIQTPR